TSWEARVVRERRVRSILDEPLPALGAHHHQQSDGEQKCMPRETQRRGQVDVVEREPALRVAEEIVDQAASALADEQDTDERRDRFHECLHICCDTFVLIRCPRYGGETDKSIQIN